jgi:hypothetical protein
VAQLFSLGHLITPMRCMTSYLLLLAAFAVSCGAQGWSFDEVARVTSPSKQVDAVLVEMNGGATTSFDYNVYVVPKGRSVSRSDAQVANLYGAVRSESAYGVDLKWDGTNRLAGEYLSAEHSEILKDRITVVGEEITITLRSNIKNSAAPSGGMHYNLRKKRWWN